MARTARPALNLSLYLVADRKAIPTEEEFIEKVKSAVEGGVSCVQLRDLEREDAAIIKTARQLRELLKIRGIPLVINSNIGVAIASKASGVYIERGDLSPAEIRRILPKQMTLGIPVSSPLEARAFNSPLVDYFSVKVFASKRTNPEGSSSLGLQGLKKIRRQCDHPIVAIGGITSENIGEVYSALDIGDGIAMAGDLLRGPDPYTLAKDLCHLLKNSRKGGVPCLK